MVELVDTLDLGSSAARRVGSTPSIRTNSIIKTLFMKIYTKKGDSGTTSMIGKNNIEKHNIRIEAYGTIDELNSHIGLLSSYSHVDFQKNKKQLFFIQNLLFKIGSSLASQDLKYKIDLEDINKLEKFIDDIETHLKPLNAFILPTGNTWTSHAHIARCVCRRSERRITLLEKSEKIDVNIIKFINRLSDYLFVLARYINLINDVNELKWKY